MDVELTEEEREDAWSQYFAIQTQDPIARKMMAREIFETFFKIHDHNVHDPLDPFPLVTTKPKRAQNWASRETIKRLIAIGAPDKTGMSLNDLLYETNMSDFEDIVEACEDVMKRESATATKLRNESEEQMAKVLNTIEERKNNNPSPLA